jgi:cell division protein FtsI/penicillin-binding protein 2
VRFVILLVSICLITGSSFGVTAKRRKKSYPQGAKPVSKPPNAARELRQHKPRSKRASFFVPSGGRAGSGPWKEPTFADSTLGDKIDGEDLVVRRAAVDALGPYNGTIVVADPSSGRILTMVNQKLALKSGFQPCSTIKIVAALAGLGEGVIDRTTSMRLYGRTSMNLTNALAHSNNNYFANVGIKLGFEKVSYYARLFGLGEKAGLNIDGEQPGILPAAPPKNGGMGMMTSFGEGITLTPLQLAGLVSAVANGGTLYYLQHPTNLLDLEHFVPRVKRHLAIQEAIPEVKPGMMGAVEYGTARRANYDPNEPIFGKTGTCTDSATPTHLGWFGSFNDVLNKKLTVVVLLTGGRPVSGPVAAGVAGNVYRNLSQQKYFNQPHTISPVAMISGGF